MHKAFQPAQESIRLEVGRTPNKSQGTKKLGLTQLPCPRDSTLCTRFATQIVCRRAEQESVTVSIIPSPLSDAAEVRGQRYREFELGAELCGDDSWMEYINEDCMTDASDSS